MFFIVLSHNNARSENGQRTVRERRSVVKAYNINSAIRISDIPRENKKNRLLG